MKCHAELVSASKTNASRDPEIVDPEPCPETSSGSNSGHGSG